MKAEQQITEPQVIHEWEPIIHFGESYTPNISSEFLPSWAGAYSREVSQCAQTPEAFGVMVGFSTLAACLQKRFEVSPFNDTYVEPLNLWTLGVLPPGARKTFVVEQHNEPIVQWERERAIALQPRIDEVETTRAILTRRIDKLEKDAANESDSSQRAALTDEIRRLKQEMPDELRAPRLFTTDCTPERFQALLVEHGERMALLSDEGGIFEIMAGLYSDGRCNLDVFLKSHAGSPCMADRASREAHLNNPLSTFGLAVQPTIIEELNRGNKRRFRGTGCLARFLYDVPESTVGKRDMTRRGNPSLSLKKSNNRED
jgi:hypothetical protein